METSHRINPEKLYFVKSLEAESPLALQFRGLSLNVQETIT